MKRYNSGDAPAAAGAGRRSAPIALAALLDPARLLKEKDS